MLQQCEQGLKGQGRETGLEADSVISLWQPESTCHRIGHGMKEMDVEDVLEKAPQTSQRAGQVRKERSQTDPKVSGAG